MSDGRKSFVFWLNFIGGFCYTFHTFLMSIYFCQRNFDIQVTNNIQVQQQTTICESRKLYARISKILFVYVLLVSSLGFFSRLLTDSVFTNSILTLRICSFMVYTFIIDWETCQDNTIQRNKNCVLFFLVIIAVLSIKWESYLNMRIYF